MRPQLEIPIRCVHCDYDLRGLAGDPVRCPECGELSRMADFTALTWNRGAETGRRGVIAGFYLTLIGIFALLFRTRVPVGLVAISMIVIFALWVRELGLLLNRLKWTWRGLANVLELQIAVPVAVCTLLASLPACIIFSVTVLKWAVSPSVSGWIRVPAAVISSLAGIAASVLVCYFLVAVTFRWAFRSCRRLSDRSREYLFLGRQRK